VLKASNADVALIKNRQARIIGYVRGFDLIAAPESASVGSICRTATFVGEATTTMDVLFRLKKERGAVAFVVGPEGGITGVVTPDDILAELTRGSHLSDTLLHVEKRIAGDLRIKEFSHRYHLALPPTGAKTFAALVEELLGHKPSVGDSTRFGPLELTVKEVGILGAKTILLKTTE
jgi:CBS domain containing-hemolysin-like protein